MSCHHILRSMGPVSGATQTAAWLKGRWNSNSVTSIMKATLLKFEGNNSSQRRCELKSCSTQKILSSEQCRVHRCSVIIDNLLTYFMKRGKFCSSGLVYIEIVNTDHSYFLLSFGLEVTVKYDQQHIIWGQRFCSCLMSSKVKLFQFNHLVCIHVKSEW